MSADVKVDNDNASERCLRLNSIARLEESHGKTGDKNRVLEVDTDELYAIIDLLETIAITDDKEEKALEEAVHRLDLLASTNPIKRAGRWKKTDYSQYMKK